MEYHYPKKPTWDMPVYGPAMDERMMRHMYRYLKMCHRMERDMMRQMMRYSNPRYPMESSSSSSSSSHYRRGRYCYPMESSHRNPYRESSSSSSS